MDLTVALQLWLGRLLEPVTAAARSPLHRRELLVALGLDSVAAASEALDDALTAAAGVAETVLEMDLSDPTPEQLAQLLIEGGHAVEALRALATAAGEIDLGGRSPEELLEDLFSLLVVRFLRAYVPLAHDVAALLTLVRVPEDEDGTGDPGMPRLRLGTIGELVGDPGGTLAGWYLGEGGLAGLATADDARLAADRLFPALSPLLSRLGVNVRYARDPGLPLPDDPGVADRMLLAQFPIAPGAGAGLALSLRSAAEGGAALLASPFGAFAFSHPAAGWTATLRVRGALQGFAVTPDGVELPDAPEDLSIAVELLLEKAPGAGGLAFRTAPAGSRLEIGGLIVRGTAQLGEASDAGVEVEMRRAAFVVAPPSGDGFLGAVLPPEGVRAEFDLGIGWSQRRGPYFHGGAGLEATLAAGASLGDVLRVDSVYLALKAGETETPDGPAGTLQAQAAASATVRIGPLTATIDRLGMKATLGFPRAGGNLGPASLALEPRFPSGVGLAVDAGPVKGGGFLFADPEKGEYAGVVQLELQGIALKAVGLLTTRMPDGSSGFSLLILISAEFTPIQLGYGFTLNAVGGLLGAHRTAAVDALRAGVRDRVLDSVMFPRDPVANAPTLIRTLSRVFPVAPGRFVLGPMARLGWGTPTLLTVDLGLVLDLPSPVRLIALGRLRLVLPDERAPLVRIHMDVLGVIDFERREASIDATLYDSEVAGFALTGDMAMRARWGSNPTFALSAGGFNPRFSPPAGFPTLRRMAIALATGNNPRLRLEAYLALTSNTVQFGARLDLYAAAMGFSIQGMLGFDALVQFDPFGFIVDIAGSVALKRGSRTLTAISVTVTLSGPRPWHARGKAKFEVLFISGTVSFDVKIGRALPPVPPPSVNVAELLAAALGDARNWAAQLPPAGESLVTLRRLQPRDDELLVHPLGEIGFDQRVVPLGRPITRYGNAPVDDDGPFDVTSVTYGAQTVLRKDMRVKLEYFAPAHFLDLTEDEKLSRPSFEQMDAGVRLDTPGREFDQGELDLVPLDYEMILIDDPDGPALRLGPEPLAATDLSRLAAAGAAGTAPPPTPRP
ncbi:MAG TPA: DUF6603 domain-containing protein, partial [Longimicrobium sp.]|nr:DUF6603 domain-containing protein [Longimicrobium sp.]